MGRITFPPPKISAMSGKRKPLYCWDSCVYFTWLYPTSPKEAKNATSLPDIREIIRLNENREVLLVTSQITMTEVLSCMDDKDVEKSFQGVFNGEYHVRYVSVVRTAV